MACGSPRGWWGDYFFTIRWYYNNWDINTNGLDEMLSDWSKRSTLHQSFLFFSLPPPPELFFFLPGVILSPFEAESSFWADAGTATEMLLGMVFCFLRPAMDRVKSVKEGKDKGKERELVAVAEGDGEVEYD
jgi:hypothetical protein